MKRYLAALSLAALFVSAMANPYRIHAADLELIGITTVDTNALTFAEGAATRFGITVNGRTHQQDAIVSHRGYQYAAYVDANRQICLARRQLPEGDWLVIRFTDHRFESNDSHNTAVIGICKNDGTIHLAFDHHADPLKYRVSQLGVANDPGSFDWDTDLFGPIQPTLGSVAAHERVTYPRFVSSPDGNLMLYYRSVTSANGDGMIERYDGHQHDWLPGYGKFISRDIGVYHHGDQSSPQRCPYMNPLVFTGNRLHASWIWRDRFKKTHPDNQHDLCYTYSDDFGKTWHSSAGEIIGRTDTDPLHLNTPGLVAFPISQEKRISNQNSLFVQDDGRVHVVLKANDKRSGERRFHHYFRDVAGNWDVEVLPFSGRRPKLVGTPDGVLFLIFSDEDDDADDEDAIFDPYFVKLAKGTPGSSQSRWDWEPLPSTEQATCGDTLVDSTRWKSQRILSIYYQDSPNEILRTESPDPVDGIPSALHVMDFRLK